MAYRHVRLSAYTLDGPVSGRNVRLHIRAHVGEVDPTLAVDHNIIGRLERIAFERIGPASRTTPAPRYDGGMIHRLLLVVCGAASWLTAQTLPRYEIFRAAGRIVVDGRLDEPAWRQAPAASAFHFNWWTGGEKEQTIAKLLWDDENLYVGFYCHDKHIAAEVVERHGPVSLDDSVEVFLSPNPGKIHNYYGFEMNVIGTMLNFIRADWYKGPFNWEPDGVRLRTSFSGLRVKDDAADDDHWILEVAIPLKNFEKDAAHIPPREGDTWRLNRLLHS